MKEIYIIEKNRIEIKERYFERFERDGLRCLDELEIRDNDPLEVFQSERREEAERFFKRQGIEVSREYGSGVCGYRQVEFYELVKETHNENNDIIDIDICDRSNFKNYFPEYAKNELEALALELENDNEYYKLIEYFENNFSEWAERYEKRIDYIQEILWIWDETR